MALTPLVALLAAGLLPVGVWFRIREVPNQLLLLGGGIVLAVLVYLPSMLVPVFRRARLVSRIACGLAFVFGALLPLAITVGGTLGKPVADVAACVLAIALSVCFVIVDRGTGELHRTAWRRRSIGYLVLAALVWMNSPASLQLPDRRYHPAIAAPAYARGRGPIVFIDEGHHNFHTMDDRYWAFAELLRRDGYRCEPFRGSFRASALATGKILVIANAQHEDNIDRWSRPVRSAFSAAEIAEVVAWVRGGGSLFLVVDHMPMPGAASELARALGFELHDGFAVPSGHEVGARSSDTFTRSAGTLHDNAITRGRTPSELVETFVTFVGSAFPLPEGATPIVSLSSAYEQIYPVSAWKLKGADRIPAGGFVQGAFKTLGTGKVVVFSEAAAFTTQLVAGLSFVPMGMNAPHASQNHQLLLNIVHWLDGA